MRDGPILEEKKAVERLRRGSVLMHMHNPTGGKQWFVVPGGPIRDDVAARIRNRPDMSAQEDGLWPGHDQTWRMRGAP